MDTYVVEIYLEADSMEDAKAKAASLSQPNCATAYQVGMVYKGCNCPMCKSIREHTKQEAKSKMEMFPTTAELLQRHGRKFRRQNGVKRSYNRLWREAKDKNRKYQVRTWLLELEGRI